MANRTKLTPEKEDEFFGIISETANVTRAAAFIGMARTYLYEVRDQDPDFKARWDKSVRVGTEALKDEATRRAVEGWDEPVFYQGVQTGLIRKYSDTLLIVQLKARCPDEYRERSSTEITGKGGGPIESVGVVTNDPVEAAKAYQRLVQGG